MSIRCRRRLFDFERAVSTGSGEVAGDEQSAERTADGRVEREDDEVSLIGVADARRREEAVVVAPQHAPAAHVAVVRARRRQQRAHRARPEPGQRRPGVHVVVAARRGHDDAASVECSPYSLAGSLR